MELTVDESILASYGLNNQHIEIQQIGSGHINRTYLLTQKTVGKKKYVLQEINTNVFANPQAVAENIKQIANFLTKKFPDYLFPAPLANRNGATMVAHQGEYWRLSPFVDQTIALDTLTAPQQAYEAAKQFGKLSRLLDNFDSSTLHETITGFHNLDLRFEQFQTALAHSSTTLREQAAQEIETAIGFKSILTEYQNLKNDLPNRVMHHDTKINNVLLAQHTYEGVCVIDLDTLMPGKFISDLGDMMRTYLCEFSENETDLSKITIRMDYFAAMIDGYLSEMGNILTETEKKAILFSGKYIIYMQALRFLADFLNGSIYYPTNYATQNLDRTKNQFKLLMELVKNEDKLQQLIVNCLAKTTATSIHRS
ncbi:phosphotransferase enzyme family protein [Pedobacter nanyangensis]|uniref:phosphotransferase enzyme family protein n=1 Tax=Pedobacter nanyangensis TaxID=1562389 RepID=UPI000DE3FAEA|nr:aminoglycoside phosphotransferase family protein [Pedobacter nanyangensis]